jgi:hypothetical protein
MMLREQLHTKPNNHRKNCTDNLPATIVITSNSSDGSESDDQEWPIKCILRETEAEYLIDWEGPYEPTWVSIVTWPDYEGIQKL